MCWDFIIKTGAGSVFNHSTFGLNHRHRRYFSNRIDLLLSNAALDDVFRKAAWPAFTTFVRLLLVRYKIIFLFIPPPRLTIDFGASLPEHLPLDSAPPHITNICFISRLCQRWLTSHVQSKPFGSEGQKWSSDLKNWGALVSSFLCLFWYIFYLSDNGCKYCGDQCHAGIKWLWLLHKSAVLSLLACSENFPCRTHF